MQVVEGETYFSASDLNNFLECEHLTTLDQLLARYEIFDSPVASPDAQIVADRGEDHEKQYVAYLRTTGSQITEITCDSSLDDWRAAADATLAAMRAGAAYIYQATFLDVAWRGRADLLRRKEVDSPSQLGPYLYEVIDIKLAQNPKPYFALQLCFYQEQLTKLQGPSGGHAFLIHRDRKNLAYPFKEKLLVMRDFEAYYRRVKTRFLHFMSSGAKQTSPEPVEHCKVCRWQDRCAIEWADKRHLSLVANIRRDQIAKLREAGVGTLDALAQASDGAKPPSMVAQTFERLRQQAQLNAAHDPKKPTLAYLNPRDDKGFALLPEPSLGDVFFDMEGDPFEGDGLEYLFGVFYADGSEDKFQTFWALERDEEQTAFEQVVRFLMERRTKFPDMHVYHYAAYERSRLQSLSVRYGVLFEEVTDLRINTLVDLYEVVRQSMLVSTPSYSLKDIEKFYLESARIGQVENAVESVVAFEQYLRQKDPQALNDIESYNRKDCESTKQLRDWLLVQRHVAAQSYQAELVEPIMLDPYKPSEKRIVEQGEINDLRNNLAEASRFAQGVEAGRDPRVVIAGLLAYHLREDAAGWAKHFVRAALTSRELVDDNEAIGLAKLVGAPIPDKQSLVATFEYPEQTHKVSAGDKIFPRGTSLEGSASVEAIDDERRIATVRRGKKLSHLPWPDALLPKTTIPNEKLREALRRFGRSLLAVDEPKLYAAVQQILKLGTPSIIGLKPGDPIHVDDITDERLFDLVAGLNESYLFVQGPPGTGKTRKGAYILNELLRRNKRLGVMANSHEVIHNMLSAVVRTAESNGDKISIVKKASAGNSETSFSTSSNAASVWNVSKNDEVAAEPGVLIAGTPWLFCDERLAGQLDYLFVDEAGQMALANLVATGMSARSIVLLGDPLQLAQVSQATHPEDTGVSVLEYLLGDSRVVPPDRGVFLTKTYRMHRDVCRFISTMVYEGKLHEDPRCNKQRVDSAGLTGTGLRKLAVEHRDRSTKAPEEAKRIADEIAKLLAGTVTSTNNRTDNVSAEDILVVAAYNAQVKCIKDELAKRGLASIKVGTVDKFQGKEGPIVFFSMATSSGDDLPRDVDFLFSLNRINVAISRAQALSALVFSPRLLDVRCDTLEEMRLVNTLCAYAEQAS